MPVEKKSRVIKIVMLSDNASGCPSINHKNYASYTRTLE